MTDYSDRKGDWIITYTGKRFYPADPREEDIDIEDIAHSLSILNRFTGHTAFPFSVGQHSLHISFALRNVHHESEQIQLAGLLHDATEAYVNDLARPVKRQLPDYTAMENHIHEVISSKFNIDTRCEAVKLADARALVSEAQRLCAGEQWYYESHWPAPYGYAIRDRNWRDVKEEFLERYEQLMESLNA
jgi:uncharacterized protein